MSKRELLSLIIRYGSIYRVSKRLHLSEVKFGSHKAFNKMMRI